MMQYRLNSLDMDPSGEINDAWSTGEVLDLPENPSLQDICDGLKSVDRMADDWPVNKVGIEKDENGDIYVLNERKKKVYQLQPQHSENPVK